MSSEVVWLRSAVSDVFRLKNFLKSKSPLAAQRAAKRILEGSLILKDNPGAGMPVVDLPGFRELKIAFGGGEYILRYREESNRVVIVRVRHSKEESF